MGEVWVVKKPSRSDEVLEVDQQIKVAEEIRAHFDSLAPKRPKKPSRSDNDATEASGDSNSDQDPPELYKLRDLQSQSHQPIYSDSGKILPDEEFVETQYYKELNSIDKQHHMTGKGFIRVAEGGEDGSGILLLQQNYDHDGDGSVKSICLRSNPATNEWIPRMDGEEAVFVSLKPNRSES